jgi:hypothetical protein
MSRHSVPDRSTLTGWLTVDALRPGIAGSSAQGARKPVGSEDGLDAPLPDR